VGRKGVEQLLAIVTDASDQRVPEVARACLAALGAQLRMLKAQILEFECLSMRSPLHQQADMVKLTAGIGVPLLPLL
jgi:hypothetical protein